MKGKNMKGKTIWLIDHKAALSECSPMKLDGSSWILGVCVLSATDRDNALIKFNAFLTEEKMELIEIYEIAEYRANEFKDGSSSTKQINNAVRMVKQDGETCYVFARTSEAMAANDGINKELAKAHAKEASKHLFDKRTKEQNEALRNVKTIGSPENLVSKHD